MIEEKCNYSVCNKLTPHIPGMLVLSLGGRKDSPCFLSDKADKDVTAGIPWQAETWNGAEELVGMMLLCSSGWKLKVGRNRRGSLGLL